MLTQKATYYPWISIEMTETRFGAKETNNPTLYDAPIEGKTILKVDTLEILKEVWGIHILMSRDKVYKLVSGNITDEEYRKLICSYYSKYASFANFIDDKYIFGDKSVPLIARITEPVRKMIDDYTNEVKSSLNSAGGKYLMESHDYIYYSFKHKEYPKLKGMDIIC